MRVISCSVKNFASYNELHFEFNEDGLSLIEGPTGSGKSTLCDVIPWILFGKTAKGGAVDEIKSWNSTEGTEGTIVIEVNSGPLLYITRKRNKAINDCYFWYQGVINRGKDLQDTQKQINNKLGFDYDLYLSGAYFHEFSQTAQFFITTAKNRRALCEQIVDLSLAKKLQISLADNKKELIKEINKLQTSIHTIANVMKSLENHQYTVKNKAFNWRKEHKKTIAYVANSYDNFEKNRKKIISNVCRSCNTVLAEPKEVIDTSENPYLARLVELEKEVNPHTSSVEDYSADIKAHQEELETTSKQLAEHQAKFSDLEQLNDIIDLFRAEIVRNTITQVETNTNGFLTRYFDGELKIALKIEGSDKLEVEIQKDGNLCSYTQLSKGQRQLLKLCFSVSVMNAISNQHAINFKQLFFDESLDGLDDNFKLKACALLESLTLNSTNIYLVEHSMSVKAMINNKYKVSLINGNSQIEKT